MGGAHCSEYLEALDRLQCPAEMDFGAGKDHTGTIRVCTFGTGIGTALCSNGQLVPNTEFGHIEIRGKEAERWGEQKARQISSPARAEQ
jgi:predicted NBD/HSP70 family sugar kinase